MQRTRTEPVIVTRSNPRAERRALLGFGMLMLLSGGGLANVGGFPRVPDAAPRLDQLMAVLAGSSVPAQPLALALLDLAWLVWLWIVGSFGVELLVEAAEVLARGAAWARSLRRVADRMTFPLARRAAAAAFAVQILSRGVPLAAAQPLTPDTTALVAEVDAQATPLVAVGASNAASESEPAGYIVRPGDTLWSIADQAYGSGMAYRRLVEANVGHRMPDGQVFTAQGVIRPGWELVVPDANLGVEEVDGQRWYTVRPGDTLAGVAAVVFGDDAQWTTLFELNRGATTPDGLHTLTNPNVIWQGLRLRVPPAVAPPVEEAQPVPADLSEASAAWRAAPPPSMQASIAPPDEENRLLPPEEIDPLPLVRILHVVEPIAVEPTAEPPVDTGVGAESAAPGDASAPPDQEVELPTPPPSRNSPLAPAALGGLGLVALAGVAFGARRLRRLRPMPTEPESEIVVEGGFAEVQLAPDITRGQHGVGFDAVTAIVDRLVRFLDEYSLSHVTIVSLRHGRSATTLTLAAGLAELSLLVDLAPVFGDKLQADVEAWISADQDVVYRVTRVRATRLLPVADALLEHRCLVPLGLLYDRQELQASLDSLGHVLIASLPGHGADTILTSLVATLTARRSPQQLRVWMVARPRALAAAVFDLPHLARSIDPEDAPAVANAAEDLRAELDRRALLEPGADLVVVIPELTSLGEHETLFACLASRAARLGVHFVAATSCLEDVVQSPWLASFGTRMVLRMQEEEASVALLGVADAAFLGGGGRLLLRLDGREPVELYGYHVAPEHLERLVRVMRSTYGSGSGSAADEQGPTWEPETSEQPLYGPSQAVDTPSEPEPTRAAPAANEAANTASSGLSANAAVSAEPGETHTQPASNTVSEPPKREPAAANAAADSVSDAAGPTGAPASTNADQPNLASSASAGAKSSLRVNTPVPPRPPIQVICLGGPRVMCAGQQVWPRRPSGEAKPWELLLYLASQPAEGVSMEAAVEALWPEDDEAANPAHRFRQLRYRLRHLLASVAGAPATDGICLERGALRLDAQVVVSDAQEFLGLVRSARMSPGPTAMPYLERARELYQGDLLEGPDARRYAWLDERDDSGVTLREHFRRLFEQATTRLAELHAVSGDLQAAVDLYRDLTEIDPADERLWQALFRLHAERGDRLALIREEHRLRAALRTLAADFDDSESSQIADPSRETVREYQRLLDSLHDREREAAAS